MPNENDNNNLPDLSIEEINDLYSDIIEFPEDENIKMAMTQIPSTIDYVSSTCSGK